MQKFVPALRTYTGIRASELVNVRLSEIDFHFCQIRINNGKGGKDRIVRSRNHSKSYWPCMMR
ncbi:tyrosine-type recombinase/integrase [Paenibacillus macerans]|uniref:tyrosine-type recombinase/integrase n=1 Tax=Paenibacillus macerans TaxID=44252 RepID=UPI003A523789